MSFRENLRRGRSHLLLVVIMLVTAGIVVAIEDDNLSRETGKVPPKRTLPITRSDFREMAERSAKPAPDAEIAGSVIQLGAYETLADAEMAAKVFAARGIADDAETRVDRTETRGGVIYRLIAVPNGSSSPEEQCAALRSDGIDCFVRAPR